MTYGFTSEDLKLIRDIIRKLTAPKDGTYQKFTPRQLTDAVRDYDGLFEKVTQLYKLHILGLTKDGNVFVSWTENKYYPGRTFKELEERVKNAKGESCEEKIKELEARIERLEAMLIHEEDAVF